MGSDLSQKISRGAPVHFVLALFLWMLSSQLAFAQSSYSQLRPTFSMAIQEKLERRISLDLRGIHVVDVLKFLSTKAELNIVASQTVEARVTLFLKDVSIGNALEVILLTTNLAFREKEGIFFVLPDQEYAGLYGEPYRDQRQIRVLQLKRTDAAERIGKVLGGLKSQIGKIIIDNETGTLILIDTAEKIRLLFETAERLDALTIEKRNATENAVFELDYNKAVDLEVNVRSFLTPGVGALKIDEKTNQLFVTDFKENIENIAELITAFDRKTREVFIEMRMVQVRLSDTYQMGINWQEFFNEGPEQNKFPLNFTGTFPKTTTTQFGRLVFGDLGRWDFEATVDVLHAFGETKTIAAPQLTVEHNEEATILVGTREAYVTSTVSQADSTTTTSEAITFIDVGVQLRIRPEINSDGFISLKITPEISSVGRTLTTANNNQIPIVDTTTADTTLLVKDGNTVVMGGLMKDDVSKTVNKFPLLGDIPLAGAFFRSTSDVVTKTELVIFITPRIIEGDEKFPVITSASGKPFAGPREF